MNECKPLPHFTQPPPASEYPPDRRHEGDVEKREMKNHSCVFHREPAACAWRLGEGGLELCEADAEAGVDGAPAGRSLVGRCRTVRRACRFSFDTPNPKPREPKP